jgi:hypothetical protein
MMSKLILHLYLPVGRQHIGLQILPVKAADLEAMLAETPDPARCLHQYPDIFRKSLESDALSCWWSSSFI